MSKSNTKMPAPVALLVDWQDDPDLGHYFAEETTETGRSCGLITTDQAEAYAAAKVREALEEAAQVCDAYFKETEEQRRSAYEEGKLDAADILEQRIRTLIVNQTGDSNVETD